MALLDHLQPHVDAALAWIARSGDSDGDGFVEYLRKAGKGLSNQGWKDSGNSVVRRDGSLACNPQAWAAGALPALLWGMLGLEPDAFTRTLRIVRPHLPIWVPWVEIHGLRLADATVDLRWERSETATSVAVRQRAGAIQVLVV